MLHSSCALLSGYLFGNSAECNFLEKEKAPLSETEQRFVLHTSRHGLSFHTSEEYQFRLDLFKKTDAEINMINDDASNTFKLGHNNFSTMTEYEMSKMFGDNGKLYKAGKVKILPVEAKQMDAAATLDWRMSGALNVVQNQGGCGSCWSFAAIATIEAHHHLEGMPLFKLSEQQLVDCDPIDEGCSGGLAMYAYQYGQDHMIVQSEDYPYTAEEGTCNDALILKKGVVGIKTYHNVQTRSVEQLVAAVSHGPVAVSVAASSPYFRSYLSGVMNDVRCGTGLNHAVVIIGYGTMDGSSYYLIRNSWGPGWGDEGHIRIGIVPGVGICGIQTRPVWPVTKLE